MFIACAARSLHTSLRVLQGIGFRTVPGPLPAGLGPHSSAQHPGASAASGSTAEAASCACRSTADCAAAAAASSCPRLRKQGSATLAKPALQEIESLTGPVAPPASLAADDDSPLVVISVLSRVRMCGSFKASRARLAAETLAAASARAPSMHA